MQCSELEIFNMLPIELANAITKKPSNCEFFLDLWSEIERIFSRFVSITTSLVELRSNWKSLAR